MSAPCQHMCWYWSWAQKGLSEAGQGLGDERRGEEAAGQGANKRPAVHYSIT
jgi:hypothetical protein